MRDKYFWRQILLALNQVAVIAYLCIMAATGNFIENDNHVHFLLLSLLLWDAAYISYRNVKSNTILKHFSYLLLLLGWQFLLSLFEQHFLSVEVSKFLLPICLYQSFYFVQAFIFQASAYQWQKQFLMICKITCLLSSVGFVVSTRVFAITYQIQFILSLAAILFIGFIHRKRICFVLRSQKRELLYSLLFVVLPFIIYIAAFHNHAGYMASMGSYLVVMVTLFSIHNIVFQDHSQQEKFPTLRKRYVLLLVVSGIIGLAFTSYLFEISLMAVFVLVHIFIFLVLLFNLLLYLQINRQPTDYDNPTDRQHFYAYSLAQIKREEALKKDFSNYLHDDILQDLLSIKNLLRKADQPDVQQLLLDTLNELNASIRLQMQAYHPTLLKSLTLKENIQNLLDTLTEKTSVVASLDCSDTVFLVEPYNILIYRMLRELVTNALKHSSATRIRVLLIQEHDIISLKVSDNGKGFETLAYNHSEHRGLTSIQEQVSSLDGTIAIQSVPGAGTQITITMPMKGGDSYESFISR